MSINRSKNVVLGVHRKKRNSIFMAIIFIFTLVFTGGMVGAATLLVGNAAMQDDGQTGAPPAPAIGGSGDPRVSYVLDVPAGVSLISSPLDAGSRGRHAIDAFIGIDEELPLLFEWDSSTQRFLDPEESLLSPGAGYLYYTPDPTTLLIHGKPYTILKHLTRDITPGWHLFGVPFTEGIDWSGFHLYASGNPMGLETARDLGWIGSDVMTMQGSSLQTHEAGAPFEPGLAYWIRTTMPLSIRGEPAAAALSDGVGTVINNVIIKDFTVVIENKILLIKTGEDIKAGKMTTGGFSGSGAVFSLANMAVQAYRYNNIMDELNMMDDKVDELLVGMGAIQSQLATIESQIEGLENWLINDATLGQPLRDAEAWIAQYYSDPTQPGQSYNWARWKLAGCDVSASTCTTTVTDASSQAFNSQYDKFPTKNPPDLATDNFYLWWSYSVLGGQANIPPYMQNGNTANNLVQSLHDGMVFNERTSQNGLRAYMEYVFSKSACAIDVTACDLYSQVYLPFEAYYQQLITNQITLVQAIVESYAVLASTDQTTHAFDSFVSDYMTGFQQKLADEAEAFVQVAEQIALYRAADGRFDWSSFNTSDAAQVLARADFLAAHLVSSATGKPWPWPPGVTGRVFYSAQQALPSATAHTACIGSICATLTEVTPESVVAGDWPYLQWTLDSSNVAIGVPTYTWKVRRLTPQQMSEGTYQAASINAQYGNANLVVAEYGEDYSNPPAEGTTPVLFGSFNNVEGKLGVGALGANRTYSGDDDKLRDFTVTPSTNYTQMTVAYKQSNDSGNGDLYERMKIRVPDNAAFGSFPRVRLFWSSTVEIALSQYTISTGSDCYYHFYQKVEQSLGLLKSDGDYKAGASQLFDPCGAPAHGIGSCNVSIQDRNDGMMLASSIITLDHSETYTLRAHYSDTLYGYYYSDSGLLCQQRPTSGSHFNWKVFNPTITLTK